MSTRIYTGFKFKSSDLMVITHQLQALEADILERARMCLHRVTACLVVPMIDMTTVAQRIDGVESKALPSRNPMSVAIRHIHDRRRSAQLRSESDPAVQWDAGMLCWFSSDIKSVIGYTHGQLGAAVRELMIDKGIADDYSYWNNSDRADGVSSAVWKRRERVWDKALDRLTGKPFRFDFSNDDILYGAPLGWDDLLPYVPTLESRIEARAHDAAFKSWAADNGGDTSWQQMRVYGGLLKTDMALIAKKEALVRRVTDVLLPVERLAQVFNEKQPLLVDSDD